MMVLWWVLRWHVMVNVVWCGGVCGMVVLWWVWCYDGMLWLMGYGVEVCVVWWCYGGCDVLQWHVMVNVVWCGGVCGMVVLWWV